MRLSTKTGIILRMRPSNERRRYNAYWLGAYTEWSWQKYSIKIPPPPDNNSDDLPIHSFKSSYEFITI